MDKQTAVTKRARLFGSPRHSPQDGPPSCSGKRVERENQALKPDLTAEEKRRSYLIPPQHATFDNFWPWNLRCGTL